MEFLRVLVAIPLLVADAVYDWLTRDEIDELIEHHRQIFRARYEGD